MGQFETLDDVLGVLRRRFALIFSVVLIGAALSLVYANSLPRTYEANALIQIELPNIADNTSTQSAGSQAKYRLNLIEQQLMARGSLEAVIAELGLFSEQSMSDFEKMDALRRAVVITQILDEVDAWRPDAVPSGLLINVRLGDAEEAALVANTFLDRILMQSEERRQELAGQALSFFENEAARVDTKITSLEAEVAVFKEQNAASMPAGISSLRDQLASLKETELEIERQIIVLKANASRVREDVLTRQVNELEVQNQLVAQRIAVINTALAAAPQVERDFSQLSRELEQLQEQLTVITKRRAEAEMGLMLESSQQTERFEVLEVALIPQYPVSPSRKKILLAGTALFLMLGAAIAVFVELLNPAIHTSAQMERELGIVPIVAIPTIGPRGGGWKRRWMWFFALFGGLLLAASPIIRKWVESTFTGLNSVRQRNQPKPARVQIRRVRPFQ
ncbi:MAG: chain-length determining protein [Rhodobacteraceae bacterium]|nr:chain-length determining protein [Paracoccaceae bacterium]